MPAHNGHADCEPVRMDRVFLRWIALVAACAVLAACGAATRLAYETADTALLLTANRYLDLEGEQRRLARGGVDAFPIRRARALGARLAWLRPRERPAEALPQSGLFTA
jgi:hypothetical protein